MKPTTTKTVVAPGSAADTKHDAVDIITIDATPPAENAGKKAYDATAKMRAELQDEDRVMMVLEPGPSGVRIIGWLPEVRKYRDKILALGHISAEEFDAMETLALAAVYADTQWLAVSRPAQPIAELLAKASDVRDAMLKAAVAASDKSLVPGDRLAELARGRSAMDVARALGAVVAILRAHWATLVGHTAVTAADLEAADALVEQLYEAIALRDGTSPALAEAAEQRVRSTSLLANNWDKIRRGMSFLRWNEGDADEIAPSIYQRSPRKRDKGDASEQPANAVNGSRGGNGATVNGANMGSANDAGNANGANAGGGASASNGAAAQGANGAAGQLAGQGGEHAVDEGMPGSRPFNRRS